ncbi:hypothetical protein HHK36_010971 [Tetracentron sinense]|uniref:RING-type E3 ubiquitin transferase n=1 Tax=Tetracentron sinense TaxID=13715 RepID=A0A834Z795_TETSI|nr:hypothetical protein HHK36_010971 [Tetracentron sinense]
MDENDSHTFNISPFSVVLIGAISATVVLVIYYCIAFGWCRQREIISRPQQSLLPEQDNIARSIDISIRELIPSYRYTKEVGLVSSTEDVTCAVCLCEFKEGDEVRVLPECIHSFHVPCIDMWLRSHSNCPLCRTVTAPSQHPLPHQPDSNTMP